jgi:hypothetical protein
VSEHGRVCWWDIVGPTVLVGLVAFLAVCGARIKAQREQAEQREHCAQSGDCGLGPGPCGCDPDHPPCASPCSGCCDGGCKPAPPPPTSSQ